MVEELWLDRETAAKELGRSVRRTLQFAAAGTIRSRQDHDKKTGRPATLLHSGDVERLREQLRTRKKTAAARALATVDKPRAQELGLIPTNGEHANGKISPWITLDEASDALRLPVECLKRLIGRGALPALDIVEGTNAKGPAWRVHPEDLQNLRGKRAIAPPEV